MIDLTEEKGRNALCAELQDLYTHAVSVFTHQLHQIDESQWDMHTDLITLTLARVAQTLAAFQRQMAKRDIFPLPEADREMLALIADLAAEEDMKALVAKCEPVHPGLAQQLMAMWQAAQKSKGSEKAP